MRIGRGIVLKGQPQSTNHLYKISNRGIYMSAKGRALKRSYQWQVKSQFALGALTIDLYLEIILFFGDRRKRDVDNYNKILLDSLNGIIYKDDSQIIKLTITKKYDKRKPRIEVGIYHPWD